MKKILSILLSALVLFSSVAFCLSAYASDTQTVLDNPLYVERPVYFSTVTFPVNAASTAKSYSGKSYYTNGKQLYLSYKNQLVQRKETVRLTYIDKTKLSSVYQKRRLLDDLFLYATDEELATGYTDGDYLRWAIRGYGMTDMHLDKTGGGYYYYTLTFRVLYYDTISQEKQVDTAVNQLINSMNTSAMSDYDIVKKVHDYICAKTTYDTKAAEEYAYKDHSYAFSPYGALVKGVCVCQGYAAAFYRICKELGFSVRFVSSDPNEGCHAWNLIALDGKYYFVDCTWDDEILEGNSSLKLPKNYYFLVNYPTLRAHDTMFVNEHALDPVYYDTTYYCKNFEDHYGEADYDRNDLSLLSRAVVSLGTKTYTYDGTSKMPAVTVTGGDGSLLENGTDYKLTYKSNINTGCARAVVSGLNDRSGDSTHRLFTIKPKGTYTPQFKAHTSSTVTLNWKASEGGVTGYKVERYVNGKWTYAGATAKTQITVSAPAAGKHVFRVTAYKAISKRNYYGTPSKAINAYTNPAATALKKPTTKKRTVTLKWTKKACSGYEIQYGLKKNMKGAKTVKVSAAQTARTLKKLKKGKAYYFRIRTYKTFSANGKAFTYYSVWSSKRAVKCK